MTHFCTTTIVQNVGKNDVTEEKKAGGKNDVTERKKRGKLCHLL